MHYSLIAITKEHDNGLIDGVWLQHCMGVDLDEAIKRARATEKVNTGGGYGEGLKVAVVELLNDYACTSLSLRMKLRRLDK